jgi:hypothetical protein
MDVLNFDLCLTEVLGFMLPRSLVGGYQIFKWAFPPSAMQVVQ